jgi:flagellar biogenesis protein FliO
MRSGFYRILALVVLAAPPAGFAQSTNKLALHADLPDVGVSVIRALGVLAILLAVVFAGVWLFRNGQRIVWRRTGVPRLAILETRPLGNRFVIYVVGYDQQRLLIGSSPAGLCLLSQLPPSNGTTDEIAVPGERASFTECLQQVLNRR